MINNNPEFGRVEPEEEVFVSVTPEEMSGKLETTEGEQFSDLYEAIRNAQLSYTIQSEKIEQLDKISLDLIGRKISNIDCYYPRNMAYFKHKENYKKVFEVSSHLKSKAQVIPGDQIVFGENVSGLNIQDIYEEDEQKTLLAPDRFIQNVQALPNNCFITSDDRADILYWRLESGEWKSMPISFGINTGKLYPMKIQAQPGNKIVVGFWTTDKDLEFTNLISEDVSQLQIYGFCRKDMADFVALPNDVIFSAGKDGRVLRHTLGDVQGEEIFDVKKVFGDDFVINCMDSLSDGQIILGSNKGRIFILNQDGKIENEVSEVTGADLLSNVTILQSLPDGRFLAARGKKVIMCEEDSEGHWRADVICTEIKGLNFIQALPDGRIIVGGENQDYKTISIYDGDAGEEEGE